MGLVSICVAGAVANAEAAGAAEAARGSLLIIGGGDRPASIMSLFACLAGGKEARVLVLPQASERPEAGTEIRAELEGLGLSAIVVASDRAWADSDEAVRLTDGATGVYFGGGDQARLMAALGGTRLQHRLLSLYREGAVIAGTSAGAAVMSKVMITGDERRPLSNDENWQTIEADNVMTAEGFGFLEGVIVDQHFVQRRRQNRLVSLVLERPQLVGIGVDESTAIWVKPDRTFEVVGDGPVLVIDARNASTARDASGYGLRGTGLRLDVLRAGSQYDLEKRRPVQLSPPAVPPRRASDCASR